MTLLEVENLVVRYETSDGPLHSVNDVSFSIDDGVNYALSGESASGKSTAVKAILGLLPDHGVVESGNVRFDGRDLLSLTPSERQDLLWEEIAFIPQTAIDALDPVMSVGAQIRQAIQTHRDVSERTANRRTRELFETVGLNPDRIDDYPHQFSGGMRQRVVIAMALALDPKLIIADEPTTGLDVIVQDKIIDNILQIQEETDSSLLLITHDLSVIAETCDEMSVLYGGKVMEQGRTDNVLLNPTHPYTMGLKNAYPSLDDNRENLVSVPGEPPTLDAKPTGCVFEPRCPFATEECATSEPEVETLPYRNHAVACYHADQAARMRRDAEDTTTWGGSTEGSRSNSGEVLLDVDDLCKWYEHSESLFGGLPVGGISPTVTGISNSLRKWYEKRGEIFTKVLKNDGSHVHAVDGVSFSVSRGEIYGIVGESGCGKSTLGQTLALLEDPTSGGFTFDGRSHEFFQEDDLQAFRKDLQIIFQNPYDSLNPRMTVGQLVKEPLTIHNYRLEERDETVQEVLEKVGMAPADQYLDMYPNELSGGQRQRVSIARALVIDPDFLICDEPASMLDVSLQAEVLNLLRGLANTEEIGVLYISHDLASLTQVADRLAIMYRGRFVERGSTEQIISDTKHPYTEALLAAVPETDPRGSRDRVTLEGKPANPIDMTEGCRFTSRCPKETDRCHSEDPELDVWTDGDHGAACFHPAESSDSDNCSRIDSLVENE
ncbi:ABC transporter ATP-binding protein [Halorubrum ezzemoulense]|uniref:dipeptide ABC transporter ATP-binding protein n=1 Tax=Halorubrum ezzemoulense TaxID=337243 RepID=UPI00232DBD2E|nr:ABC transporter ATP-binding protein [Halorubrum ezzemoulense]MDB9281459.1 ABC transporter ATP-binding protein [Halorubrum ezzemoulense]MDB9284989.1 ABC transporter ATP-binding protein [Halorubrum ezzemoulense]